MGEVITVTGMVLSAMPVGDYDKRLVILTKERGKITAFSKGSRRQNSPLLAPSRPFAFGSFVVYEGRNAYTLQSAEIIQYYEQLTTDMEGVTYGFYFLEFADYYGRENVDAGGMLNLLYVTLKALQNPNIPNSLIKLIYELRLMVINGEYPQVFECIHCKKKLTKGYFSSERGGMFCEDCKSFARGSMTTSEAVTYAMQYIVAAPLEKLYTFTLTKEVEKELKQKVEAYKACYIDKQFKTLSVLEAITT